ncbi:unnamed protein product [Urochloa decumbens]|uniref:F-box domain-containing protein n=1 Tax=Urochloa decumbens TaxID=240449 RepID=A0ABC9GW36_9POAL
MPALSSGRDRISDLPDDALHHVLSFLEARQAIRTSLLARRWRHLWKSATGLQVVSWSAVQEIRAFVDRLLLLREASHSHLRRCELYLLGGFSAADEPRMNFWIRQAVRNVRVFRLVIVGDHNLADPLFHPDGLPLVSRHLTRLELQAHIEFNDTFLNFSGCPALEELEITGCDFTTSANRISSISLKHLSICGSFSSRNSRTRIHAPNLVSLWLELLQLKVPTGTVVVDLNRGQDCKDVQCRDCYSIEDDSSNDGCVLLKGLSQAKKLALIAESKTFIFRRDLKRCPMFSNLKILLLNEHWCAPADLHALSCILEHSPVLEKPSLQLFSKGPRHKVKMKGSRNPSEIPTATLQHLETVEVKCEVIDEIVLNVLKFLSKLDIRFSFED